MVSKDLEIRLATKTDLPAIVDIYNSTIPSQMVTADTTAVSLEQKTQWFQEHNSSYPLWVIETQQKILGWLSFSPFYGRPAYQHTVEISIYVHELHRKKGVGETLMSHALKMGQALDHEIFLGFIFSHNYPSIHFFEKHGFKKWGLLPDVAKIDTNHRSLAIYGVKI